MKNLFSVFTLLFAAITVDFKKMSTRDVQDYTKEMQKADWSNIKSQYPLVHGDYCNNALKTKNWDGKPKSIAWHNHAFEFFAAYGIKLEKDGSNIYYCFRIAHYVRKAIVEKIKNINQMKIDVPFPPINIKAYILANDIDIDAIIKEHL